MEILACQKMSQNSQTLCIGWLDNLNISEQRWPCLGCNAFSSTLTHLSNPLLCLRMRLETFKKKLLANFKPYKTFGCIWGINHIIHIAFLIVESPAVLLPFALCILPDFPRPQGGDGRLSPSTNSKGHEGSAGKGQIPSKRSTHAVISTNSFGKSAPVRPTRSAVKHSHQGSHRRCSSHAECSWRSWRVEGQL